MISLAVHVFTLNQQTLKGTQGTSSLQHEKTSAIIGLFRFTILGLCEQKSFGALSLASFLCFSHHFDQILWCSMKSSLKHNHIHVYIYIYLFITHLNKLIQIDWNTHELPDLPEHLLHPLISTLGIRWVGFQRDRRHPWRPWPSGRAFGLTGCFHHLPEQLGMVGVFWSIPF